MFSQANPLAYFLISDYLLRTLGNSNFFRVRVIGSRLYEEIEKEAKRTGDRGGVGVVVFPLPSRPVSIVMATFGVWSNFNFSEKFLSIKYRFTDYIKHEEVNDFMGKLQFM